MSVPPDSHTRTAHPHPDPGPDPLTVTAVPPADEPPGSRTATAAPDPGPSHHTRPFEGTGSPAAFPTPDDRYVLHTPIARGGMGEVFAARDRALNREVAVKVLREDLKDRPFVAGRFVEEARITGQLQHPGIPPVHDLGTLRDGRPYIAMKLIKGRTLSDLLAKDRPELAELLRVFEHVCMAVAYAHDRRVIHRDLKPGNVMVGQFGEVQVMDWGLAKVLGESGTTAEKRPADTATVTPASIIESDRDPSSHTRAGSLLGTPAYMPPEQAKGEIDRTDTRSDVFALGAVLCELLTGRPPYWADTAAEVQALALTAQLGPALDRLDRCDADPELAALAKHCLSPDPADRPADATAVARVVAAHRAGVEDRLRQAELDRAAAEAKAAEEVNTRREAEAREAERRKRRRVQQALAAAGVLLLLGGGAAAWWIDRQHAERHRIESEAQAEIDRLDGERKAVALREQMEEEKRTREEKARLARNADAIGNLLDQCDIWLRADDPDRAAVVLSQVSRRWPDGGAEPLTGRAERSWADLHMLRALDRADDAYWGTDDWKARYRAATNAWAAAFKDYGIVPGITPPPAAAGIVNSSLIRDRLLIALDLWHMYRVPVPTDEPVLKALIKHDRAAIRKLLDAIDPDPYRAEVRDLVERGGDKTLTATVTADPRALRQPVRFAVILARLPNVPLADRERLLRPAVNDRPDLLPLLLTLAGIYQNAPEFRSETLVQQFRWAQAAVSVRPTSKAAWRHLARAFLDRGNIPDSVACYKRALRLDPDDVSTLNALTAVLVRKHDPEAAEVYARRAVALAPNDPLTHNNLGSVLDRRAEYGRALAEYQRAVDLDALNGTESATNFNNLGYALLRKGETAKAIGYFRDALRVSPDFRLAEANLAYALEARHGRPPEVAPPPREKER